MFTNRLTAVGERRRLKRFQNTDWLAVLAGRHAELLELKPRFVCAFETTTDPLPALRRLAREHPGLVLLLESEYEYRRGGSLPLHRTGVRQRH